MAPRVPHIFKNGVEYKKCGGCKEDKKLIEFGTRKSTFDGKRGTCKKCELAYRETRREKKRQKGRERYKRKREFLLEQSKEYQRKNKTSVKAKQKEWQSKNRERINAQRRIRQKKRRKEEPEWAIRQDIGSRICHILGGRQKCASTLELMGCTLEELRAHIETQFETPMTWENRGIVWHIDHIVPFNAFKGELDNEKSLRIVCWYRNLQPLLEKENLEKSGTWTQQEKDQLIRLYDELH